MSTVDFDTSTSLDGFTTAEGRAAQGSMGPGGRQLVEWAGDTEYLEQNIADLVR